MLLASQPIDILMRHRKSMHRWDVDRWIAAAVTVPGPGMPPAQKDRSAGAGVQEWETRLNLELYSDENDAYFENWAAPEPKVFVMWQLQGELAVPIVASVSYAEGARMLDSGEQADGLPMPQEVHSWLAAYLKTHYRPRQAFRGAKSR